MLSAGQEFTAFVLAGGKSTRMGTDKAFVRLRGRYLLEHALQAVRAVTAQVMIVGEPAKFSSFARVVEDNFPDKGPLGGIHAALCATATDWNLVVAVDLPFVIPEFLKFLCGYSRQPGNAQALAVVPRAGHGFQPLCALYRQPFADLAAQALRRDQNRIDSLFQNIQIKTVDEAEISRAGFSLDIFRNLNTPEDLAAAETSG
jgi:molybdopterin-guanine dinucleotide biosynthesis protein A